MKKNFVLALAAIFALLLASAFADNDIEPADILYERTTIHANSNYDETPLSDAEVTLILNAGFSAPTGGNQRSTNFFVITDREVMKVIQTGHPYSQPLIPLRWSSLSRLMKQTAAIRNSMKWMPGWQLERCRCRRRKWVFLPAYSLSSPRTSV